MIPDKLKPADAELVAQTLEGNREAFAGLYDRYARLVRAVVRGVAVDRATVEDLAQDCFMRAFRRLDQLRQPDRFGAWLVGIARQVGREKRRGLARERLEFPGDLVVAVDGRTEAAWSAEEWQLVLDEVAALPERERLAIQTFFLDERDVEQTARLLNLSRSGVYALLARACHRLTRRLSPKVSPWETRS